MEESLYHKIRKNVDACRTIQNPIIKSINLIRDNKMKEVYLPIQEGRASSPKFYKDYIIAEKEMGFLDESDFELDLKAILYRDKLIFEAIKN